MRLLTIFSLLLFSLSLLAQSPAFSVQTNTDEILLGNQFTIVFALENAQSNSLDLPAFNGFAIVSGPRIGTNMSIINGVVSQSTTYAYTLAAHQEGEFWIDPAGVQLADDYLETEPLKITVLPNPEGIIQEAPRMTMPFHLDFGTMDSRIPNGDIFGFGPDLQPLGFPDWEELPDMMDMNQFFQGGMFNDSLFQQLFQLDGVPDSLWLEPAPATPFKRKTTRI